MNNNDIIFFYVWRNVYINSVIFNFVKLYKKNRYMEFEDLESLRSYGEREYITKLKYPKINNGKPPKVLEKGDLPKWGALKKLDLSQYNTIFTNCDEIIPYGVENINFCIYGSNEIQLSELPLSVSTISNLSLKKPYGDNPMPDNITSLSFNSKIDANQFYDIILPSSIIKLDLSCVSTCKLTNKTIPTSVLSSFIPSSVTDLTTYYDETYALKSKIPSIPESVRKLCLIVGGFDGSNFEKGIIPFGVEYCIISVPPRGLGVSFKDNCFPESITKLVIRAFLKKGAEMPSLFTPTSIPSSVLDLHLTVTTPYKEPSFLNIFPKSLTTLNLLTNNNINDQMPSILSELPSIKYFKINGVDIDISKINI